MVFRSDKILVNVTLDDDHVSTLCHHLFSSRVMADQGHELETTKRASPFLWILIRSSFSLPK